MDMVYSSDSKAFKNQKEVIGMKRKVKGLVLAAQLPP